MRQIWVLSFRHTETRFTNRLIFKIPEFVSFAPFFLESAILLQSLNSVLQWVSSQNWRCCMEILVNIHKFQSVQFLNSPTYYIWIFHINCQRQTVEWVFFKSADFGIFEIPTYIRVCDFVLIHCTHNTEHNTFYPIPLLSAPYSSHFLLSICFMCLSVYLFTLWMP